jgi:hypothetical protein
MSTIPLSSYTALHLPNFDLPSLRHFYYAPVSDISTPINNSRYIHGSLTLLGLQLSY